MSYFKAKIPLALFKGPSSNGREGEGTGMERRRELKVSIGERKGNRGLPHQIGDSESGSGGREGRKGEELGWGVQALLFTT